MMKKCLFEKGGENRDGILKKFCVQKLNNVNWQGSGPLIETQQTKWEVSRAVAVKLFVDRRNPVISSWGRYFLPLFKKGFYTSQVMMSWFFHQHSSYIPWETGWLILDPQEWLSNKPSIDVSYNPRKNTANNQGFGSLLASIKRQLDCNDSVNSTPKQYLTHLTR